MNNETVNYAYLCGLLQSDMYMLAYDQNFEKLNTAAEKREYINNLIANTNEKAKAFAKKYNTL